MVHTAEYDLNQFNITSPETRGRAQEIVIPHSAESLIVIGYFTPSLVDVFMPRHQGRVVIRTEVMDIFDDEFLFHRCRNLGQRWKDATREYIAIKEGIRNQFRKVRGDSVVQHHTVFGQKLITLAEESFEIFWSHVFHHSHRNDSIELAR